MFCEQCGTENRDDDSFCKNCGASLKPTLQNTTETFNSNVTAPVYNSKSMALAIILSIIIGGLGLIYAGSVKRGIVFLIVIIIFNLLFPVIAVLLWIIQLADTYYVVKQINNGEEPLFLGNYDFLM